MMQRVSGRLDRISRQTSTPLPSGNRASKMATSGRTAGIRWRASRAVAASPTTVMSVVVSSRSINPRRTISWSSSKNTVIGLFTGASE